MLISYADQLRACSDAFQTGMEGLIQQGVPYYDDRAFLLAQQAVINFAPDVIQMSGERVAVEADLGIALEGKSSRPFTGLAASAILRSVKIQELQEEVREGDSGFTMVRHDLCAEFVPAFQDPDPVDLVFAGSLYVPFSAVGHLSPHS